MEQTYRNWSYPFLGWAGIAVVGTLAFAASIGVALDAPSPLAGLLSVVGVGLVGTALMWLLFRAYVRTAIVASDRGVEVHNPFRTVTVPWRDIDRFEAGACLRVILRDGTSLSVWAVQAANAARMTRRESFADQIAQRLSGRLAESPEAQDRPSDAAESTTQRRRALQRQAIMYALFWLALLVVHFFVHFP